MLLQHHTGRQNGSVGPGRPTEPAVAMMSPSSSRHPIDSTILPKIMQHARLTER